MGDRLVDVRHLLTVGIAGQVFAARIGDSRLYYDCGRVIVDGMQHWFAAGRCSLGRYEDYTRVADSSVNAITILRSEQRITLANS